MLLAAPAVRKGNPAPSCALLARPKHFAPLPRAVHRDYCEGEMLVFGRSDVIPGYAIRPLVKYFYP